MAKRIRFEREQQFKESQSGYRLKTNKAIGFIDYFQSYIDSYTKKDIRMMQIALQRFKDFLSFSDKYSIYSSFIRPDQLNKDMMIDFTDYLKSRSRGFKMGTRASNGTVIMIEKRTSDGDTKAAEAKSS